MKRVILFSNGLDSVVLKAWVEKNKHKPGDILIPVYFNYNDDLYEMERNFLPKDIRVIHCNFTEGVMFDFPSEANCSQLGPIWIPGRNLTLMSMAVSRFLPDEIYYGVLANENISNYADKDDEFVKLAEDVLSKVSYKPVRIFRPFVDLKLGKPNIITLGKKMGIVDEMLKSNSCMNTEKNPCGKCYKCVSRCLAFKMNGIEVEDILDTPEAKEIISKSPHLKEMKKYVDSGNILTIK